MPRLMRMVGKVNRWFKSDAQPLLDAGDVPADPLGDLRTSNNGKLSVYQVGQNLGDVERIARALALGRDKIDNVGFVLFDISLLEKASIELDQTDGKTPDPAVNKSHVDLINLTGNKLVTLTRLILLEGETGTVLEKRIVKLVEEGLDSKELPEKVRQKLSKTQP